VCVCVCVLGCGEGEELGPLGSETPRGSGPDCGQKCLTFSQRAGSLVLIDQMCYG
jgi:hypothetical protein